MLSKRLIAFLKVETICMSFVQQFNVIRMGNQLFIMICI